MNKGMTRQECVDGVQLMVQAWKFVECSSAICNVETGKSGSDDMGTRNMVGYTPTVGGIGFHRVFHTTLAQ